MEPKHTKVNCIECPKCKDLIYSRARHDFRSCSCGTCSIDGGFDYRKVSFQELDPPVSKEISVLATKDELYEDWNLRYDKFGRISQK